MNVNREMLAFLRKQYPVGTRIRLDSMQDPYAPVEAGTTGKLDYIDDAGHNAKFLVSRIRRTDTAIVRSHFFPAAYAGSPCPRPLYAGYESERYCRNGGYHTITGGKIHPRCTAEAAPVLCASEMDGQSMSVSKEKRCMT